jgi:hypothetical protein
MILHMTCQDYTLKDSYNYTNFFDNFIFETISDPTHGTVQYIDALTARSSGLANYTADNKIFLGVGKFYNI